MNKSVLAAFLFVVVLSVEGGFFETGLSFLKQKLANKDKTGKEGEESSGGGLENMLLKSGMDFMKNDKSGGLFSKGMSLFKSLSEGGGEGGKGKFGSLLSKGLGFLKNLQAPKNPEAAAA